MNLSKLHSQMNPFSLKEVTLKVFFFYIIGKPENGPSLVLYKTLTYDFQNRTSTTESPAHTAHTGIHGRAKGDFDRSQHG